jgi:hypothetical protein
MRSHYKTDRTDVCTVPSCPYESGQIDCSENRLPGSGESRVCSDARQGERVCMRIQLVLSLLTR